MFLPQGNHDRAILNVKHKPGARKATTAYCAPPGSHHLYLGRQMQPSGVECTIPSLFQNLSPQPHLLLDWILLLRSAASPVIPLRQADIFIGRRAGRQLQFQG